MADHDTGFLEGDRFDTSFKVNLVFRVTAFLVPHRRWVAVASGLILVSILLELAMPYITRSAIDGYLVPYYLRLDADGMPSELRQALLASADPAALVMDPTGWYLPESNWRELDPGLTARLRGSGAVGARRWYGAPIDDRTGRLAERYPDLFVRAKGRILIADDHLEGLATADLRQLRRSDAYGLIFMAALFSITAVAILAVSFFQTICLERAGQHMMMDLRLFLYHHILSRSLLFFSKNPVGKLVTRINNDVQSIAELFRNMLVGLFKDLFLFAGIAVVMFALNARLAAVCMLTAPFMAVIAYFFARISRRIFRRLKGYTGQLNTLLQETLAGITAVKLMGAEGPILGKLTDANTRYFKAGMAQTRMFAVFTPLMDFLGSLAIALIIWYGGGIVIQDRLSLGTLVAFIAYMQMLLIPVRDLSEKYNQLQGALASLERIYAVLDAPETLSVVAATPKAATDEAPDIVFRSVSFGYRPERNVFENFNLTISKGQTIALVGPSGAGKSTLVNLLLRLHDPRKGTIFLNGRDLTSVPTTDLAHRVALVGQEMILLAADIRENITLGRQDISPEQLEDAMDISGVTTWLNDLAEGAGTRIGEGGRPLSQGQCQMLALARALAGNPGILILDEAFSQIDPQSEELITSRLPSIMSGRTCIIVAHRLSTARQAQRILVLRNGGIVEDGDHRTLVDAGGIYADMTALENLDHRPVLP